MCSEHLCYPVVGRSHLAQNLHNNEVLTISCSALNVALKVTDRMAVWETEVFLTEVNMTTL